MNFISTRGGSPSVDFAEALLRGMAPDGGLYMPEDWPALDPALFDRASAMPYGELLVSLLDPFVGRSLPPGTLLEAARRLTASFGHEAVTPLVQLEPDLWMLELFHGPTAAFKDLAMQLMAPLTEIALAQRDERLLLFTATSGDTGAAAVRAFGGAANVRLVVLHPFNRVSPVQRRQMTTSGADNVLNLAIEGDFDDCQRLVKGLLADEGLRARARVSSVNSINIGRLLGQVPYYVAAASALARPGRPVDFAVPTGNFGDAFAGWIARRLGAPVGRLVAAVNANDSLARALDQGIYARRRATPTASVSMDVQAPSNFERLVHEAANRDSVAVCRLFETFAAEGAAAIPPAILDRLRQEVSALAFDDDATACEIRRAWDRAEQEICPHTAVALAAARGARGHRPMVALSTAHPAKFPEFVQSALGRPPRQNRVLAALSEAEERFEVMGAEFDGVMDRARAFQFDA